MDPMLAALILLLIGWPQHEIINDYILTRANLENVRENLTQALALNEGTDYLSPEAIRMFELSSVRAQAIAVFLKTFHSTYGSGAEGCMATKLGLSHEDVKLMCKNLAA